MMPIDLTYPCCWFGEDGDFYAALTVTCNCEKCALH